MRYAIKRYNFYTGTWVQVEDGSADTLKEAIKIADRYADFGLIGASGGKLPRVIDVVTGEVVYEGGMK